MHDDHPESSGSTLPRIKIPEPTPVTPEEIERRRALFAQARELREATGPIGIPVEDLIHELRGGDNRFDK